MHTNVMFTNIVEGETNWLIKPSRKRIMDRIPLLMGPLNSKVRIDDVDTAIYTKCSIGSIKSTEHKGTWTDTLLPQFG